MRLVPLLQISVLLGALWGAGEVAETLGLPALVAEILVGMLLGPEGTDLVPHVDAFTAAGQLGLLLLVLEGGLHVEMATIRRVGSKAFAIAISGTTLPVLLSMAVLPALPPFSLRDALVAGTSLSRAKAPVRPHAEGRRVGNAKKKNIRNPPKFKRKI